MERPAIYNQWPKPVVDQAFEKYLEKYEIIQHGPFFDHTGEDMSDFEEDVNYIPAFHISGALWTDGIVT